jgi:hypothetical protein
MTQSLFKGVAALPEYAGTTQPAVEVVVEFEKREPVQIIRMLGFPLKFDDLGKLVLADSGMRSPGKPVSEEDRARIRAAIFGTDAASETRRPGQRHGSPVIAARSKGRGNMREGKEYSALVTARFIVSTEAKHEHEAERKFELAVFGTTTRNVYQGGDMFADLPDEINGVEIMDYSLERDEIVAKSAKELFNELNGGPNDPLSVK